MTPRSSFRPDAQHQRTLVSRLETLADRLEATENRQRQLERTVAALARDAGLSVGCPCVRCNRSNMIIKPGSMYCPECGYSQSI